MSNRFHRSMMIAWMAAFAVFSAGSLRAVDNPGVVQGVVKDASGAPVAGAFVKLHNADRRLVMMVISQAQGKYTANNLPVGQWVVEGIGGEFQSQMSAPLDVTAGKPVTADLALTEQRAPALPNAWPGRTPGQGGGETAATGRINAPDGAGKMLVMGKCQVCHDAARIVSARHDQADWQGVVDVMQAYAQGSDYAKPLTDQESKTLMDYLVANFSEARARGGRGRQAPDPNSRLPRTLMTGDAMKYIAVEYTLPNPKAEPHEVAVDNQGNGWVTQRTGGRLGRLDIKNFTYSEVDPPAAASKVVRLNGIVRGEGNTVWFVDAGPNRRFLSYDTKAKEFNSFPLPKLRSGSASGNTMRVLPDGTVWLCSLEANQIIGLDPKTKEFKVWDVPAGVAAGKSANPYGMAVSGDNKVWFVENALDRVGRVDPATGKFDDYPVPVKDSVVRKMGMDSSGNIWVGIHIPGKLMKVDYKTIQMTVFDPPTQNSGVYSVQGDPTSKLVWFSQQQADKIGRFDPTTQKFTEFALPTVEEDDRRIEIDPHHPNRIWWSGDSSGRMGYIELQTGKSM